MSTKDDPSKKEPEPPKPDETKYMTPEDFNKGLSERFNRFAEKQLPDLITKAVAPLLEKLQTPPEPTKPEPTKPDDHSEKRFKAMEMQLAEERKARELEKNERLRGEERTALSEALEVAGVTDPVFKKAAIATLYGEEKRVVRESDGSIKFKVQREGYEESLDIKDGVKHWAGTDEGKRFRAPSGAQGSGQTPGGKTPRNGKSTKQERVDDAVSTLNSAFFGRSS
jgi:hypothetical protein